MASQLGDDGASGDPTQEPATQPWQRMNEVLNSNPAMNQAQGLVNRGSPGLPAVGIGSFSDASFSGQLGSARTVTNARGGRAGTPNQYTNVKSAIAQLHNMPQDWLAAHASRLYAAGFYPDSAYSKGAKPPDGKVVTDQDILANMKLIATAQRYGDTKTIDEILDEFTKAGEGQKKLDDGSGTRSGAPKQGQVYNIVTDDPATLRATVTKTAQALLGRTVSEHEQNALVELMIQQERDPQEAAMRAGQTADAGSDVRLETARVDAEARINEKLQAQNPAEAQAYSQLNYFNLLSQSLRGQ